MFFAGLGVIMCLTKSIKQRNGLNSPEAQPLDVFNNLFAGKYVNGTTLVVDFF